MKPLASWLTCLLAAVLPLLAQDASWQITPEIWQQSEEKILRLSPTAFSELPKIVIEDLQKRGCTVSQATSGSGGQSKRTNVIRGNFDGGGEMDWAVLCSRRTVPSPWEIGMPGERHIVQRSWASSVLVYLGGSVERVAEMGKRYDMNDLVGAVEVENGRYVYRRLSYTRALRVVDEKYIRERNDPANEYHAPPPAGRADTEIAVAADVPPPINHQGIDDPFQEKASTVHFFYEGKWIELHGAD